MYNFNSYQKTERTQIKSKQTRKLLKRLFPAATKFTLATPEEDKAGVDLWVTLPTGRIGVDIKFQRQDLRHINQDGVEVNDHLYIETWSEREHGKVGWCRKEPTADLILWYWPNTDRYELVSAPALFQAVSHHWETWSDRYFEKEQTQKGLWEIYTSVYLCVPREVVLGAVRNFQDEQG